MNTESAVERTQALAVSHTANGQLEPNILNFYTNAGVKSAWPPAIPAEAQIGLVGGFTSMLQMKEVRHTFDIRIKQSAYNKMMFFVLNAPGEVSGYGEVVRVDNSFLVEDVMMLEQVNGATHSLITPETTLKFRQIVRKRGLKIERFRLWWHSHNDFGVFFSSTDQEQIESLTTDHYTLSIVVNKMLDHRCRVDFYRPVRFGMDHLPLKIVPEVNPRKAEELKAEMAQLTKKSPRRSR